MILWIVFSPLNRINFLADVNNCESLHQITKRLPDHMKKMSLQRFVGMISRQTLLTLVNSWVSASRLISILTSGTLFVCDNADERSTRNQQKIKGFHSASEEKPPDKRPVKCYLCQSPHKVFDRPTFVNFFPTERLTIVRDLRLCYSCVLRGNKSDECRSKKQM